MKSCKDCPYIKDEYYRIRLKNKSTKCEIIVSKCSCYKVGGEIGLFGCCNEEADNVWNDTWNNKHKRRPRKSNGYARKQSYKRHLANLADNARGYPAGAYRVGYDGWWTDDINETKYIKRSYRGNHGSRRSRYLKNVGNRRVRRYKEFVPNRGGYKKVFDFWWELT